MKNFKFYWNWFLNSWLYRPAILFIVTVFVAIILDQFVMPYYIKLGEEIEMPDVIEMNIEEATQLLTEQGFNVLIKDSLYDANHELGTIIEQNPYPYALVKEGRRVYLTISIGEKPILMPNLFGVSPREAELILETYNLILNARNYVYSDMYPEGTVMGQSYPPGQEIKAESKINITISLGTFKEEKEMPNLVGKSLYEARERLRKLEIEIGDITYQVRDNILPETVLSQSIDSGTAIDPGDRVDLVVSKEHSE